jgi:hypothetical protein
MRILLRDKRTSLYYAGGGRWTEDRTTAQAFANGDALIDEALLQGLQEAEIVYAFEDPAYDLTVPIRRS